jgi:hypothetical protein
VSPGVDIELREVGGKDQFPKRLSLFLVDPGFPQVKAYAIIRDADSNNVAFSNLRSFLERFTQ